MCFSYSVDYGRQNSSLRHLHWWWSPGSYLRTITQTDCPNVVRSVTSVPSSQVIASRVECMARRVAYHLHIQVKTFGPLAKHIRAHENIHGTRTDTDILYVVLKVMPMTRQTKIQKRCHNFGRLALRRASPPSGKQTTPHEGDWLGLRGNKPYRLSVLFRDLQVDTAHYSAKNHGVSSNRDVTTPFP